jgi:hypothetical protein
MLPPGDRQHVMGCGRDIRRHRVRGPGSLQSLAGSRRESRAPCQHPRRTLMRPPVVKRQTSPRSGFCQFFSAVGQAERRASLATCSVFLSACWCTNVAAPNTSCGSVALVRASPARHAPGLLRPSNFSVPSYRPTQRRGCPQVCAREHQVRGRGSPRPPATTSAVWSRVGADVQAKRQAQGQRPRCSAAFATPCPRQQRARETGSSRIRQ